MGDAEFAGGGSVDWRVTNSDPEPENPKESKGRDKDPKDDGSFAVIVNDELVATPSARKGNKIQILWGPDAVAYLSARTQTTQAPPKK
jgi:hypothetical protein